MTVSISPLFNEAQYFDNNGQPLSGGKIFQYEAGSFTVQQTTYSDEGGLIANPNPIILDSSGRTTHTLYLTNGLAYNLVLTMPDGTTILKYSDFVVGVQPAAVITPGISVWNTVAETPTYVNPTTFIIPGVNYVTQFAVGNRVRITYADTTTSFGTVTGVSFSGGNTTVILAVDSGVLLSNMSAAAWSSLVSTGITVDAAGVSYKSTISYAAGSVGNKINTVESTLTASIAAANARITRNSQWAEANFSTPYQYTTTLSPIPTNLSEPQSFTLIFIQGNGGNASTLNVNGLGPAPLQQYESGGNLVPARITAFMTSQVVWSGGAYLVLDRLPDPISAAPHGMQVFTSNNTFTVPANVYSIKVTCVGGGGQGGDGSGEGAPYGPGGGGGATAISYLSVTPGQTYSVSIGAGSVDPFGVGGTTSFGVNLVAANGGGTVAGGTTGIGQLILGGSPGFASNFGIGGSYVGGSIGGGLAPGNPGTGGYGGYGGFPFGSGAPGNPGICYVEW